MLISHQISQQAIYLDGKQTFNKFILFHNIKLKMKTKKNILFACIIIFLCSFLVIYWIARKDDKTNLDSFQFHLPDKIFETSLRKKNGNIKTINNSKVVDSIVTISILLALIIIVRNLCKTKKDLLIFRF